RGRPAGPGRRSAPRPQPAQVQGSAGEVPLVTHLRHAAEHEATKVHRLLALSVPAKDVRHARGGRSRHPARRRRIEAETALPPPRTAVSGYAPTWDGARAYSTSLASICSRLCRRRTSRRLPSSSRSTSGASGYEL